MPQSESDQTPKMMRETLISGLIRCGKVIADIALRGMVCGLVANFLRVNTDPIKGNLCVI